MLKMKVRVITINSKLVVGVSEYGDVHSAEDQYRHSIAGHIEHRTVSAGGEATVWWKCNIDDVNVLFLAMLELLQDEIRKPYRND